MAFHYGSIKIFNAEDDNFITELESQFHYGSIKTLQDTITYIKSEQSQFHYGSIKTH